ncbi:MAG: 3-phosphoserine/phosphohydroxythreonine transaminase [Myxococcales bacterium]|nr:3-phosphoserine/phosphohydroxythreonine transaminase [Myxococcales bacterium]
MKRALNFNAGPAAIPLPALERARDELLDFNGSGMSIMEHSHRGKDYESVHREAIALLRRLLGVSDAYEVLFLTGGASQQFAQVPMNFLGPGRSADYVITGGWSEKAFEEAQRVGAARVACTTKRDGTFTRVPTQDEVSIDPSAAYVHVTSNNTLYGTQWHWDLDPKGRPLVSDMSSDFLWKPFDVSRYDFIYAGAQKNLGPSGVLIALVKKSFLAEARADIPVIFRYATHAKNDSLYNTPPTFAIYMVRNVLAWLEGIGGLPAIEARNREKASLLYGALDRNEGFYRCPVERASRSTMNVVWRLASEALEDRFVAEAKTHGMIGLKGHRSVGGLRASIYNAVDVATVKALADFVDEFAKKNG